MFSLNQKFLWLSRIEKLGDAGRADRRRFVAFDISAVEILRNTYLLTRRIDGRENVLGKTA